MLDKLMRRKGYQSVVFSVLFSVLFVAVVVNASTTIDSNINTGGSLTVTGVATLGNNVTVPAAYGLDVASAGALSLGTTTATSINIGQSGVNTNILGNAIVTEVASTTQLKVGSDQVSTVSGMIFGFCTLSSSVTVSATSTAYGNCTGATGVTSSYRVFLQATSSLPTGLVLVAASSTATTGTINVQFGNFAASTTASTLSTGAISLNFWAVR